MKSPRFALVVVALSATCCDHFAQAKNLVLTAGSEVEGGKYFYIDFSNDGTTSVKTLDLDLAELSQADTVTFPNGETYTNKIKSPTVVTFASKISGGEDPFVMLDQGKNEANGRLTSPDGFTYLIENTPDSLKAKAGGSDFVWVKTYD